MNHDIIRIEDAEGLNYIVQSKLTHFDRKTIADKFSIKSVHQGVEHYVINDAEYQVEKRNFIIVNPGQEVEVNIDSISTVEGVCIFLEPKLVNQIRFAIHNSVAVNLDNINPESSDITFDNIPVNPYYTFLNDKIKPIVSQGFEPYEISEYLMATAEQMVRHQYQTRSRLADLKSVKIGTKKELYSRIQKGRQFIHDNFQKPITLKDMSRVAALSEYYFHRLFSSFFKISPYQYHNQIRMEKARNLLQMKKYSRSEVAHICGFQNSKYFSKAFKKWQLS